MTINANMSVSEVKKYVEEFNKSFFSGENQRDELQEIVEKMNTFKNSKFLNKSFVESLNNEIKSLEDKMKVQVGSFYSFFAEVAHYVWTHPEKKSLLVVTNEMLSGQGGGPQTYYCFSGELGWLLEEAAKPANEFGLIWFVDFDNQKKSLINDASWTVFSNFFLKKFCDEKESFREAFKKVAG